MGRRRMVMVALFFSSSGMGARKGSFWVTRRRRCRSATGGGAKRVPDGGKGELENPRETEEYSVTEEEEIFPRNFCLLISNDKCIRIMIQIQRDSSLSPKSQ